MASLNHFFLLLCLPSLVLSHDQSRALHKFPSFWRRASSRNVPAAGFHNPLDTGGSFFTKVEGTFPPGQVEPVNMVISANSDEDVLKDREDGGGLRNYWLSLDFGGECLGQHSGSDQQVNLGDGNGYKNQTAVMRYNYQDPQLGTCKESIQGGNHFRYWVQDGSQANTGAIFMAASYEKPIAENHDIVSNGYNLGRDYIIGNITGSAIPTLNLTNQTTYTGTTQAGGYTYESHVQYLTGLLPNTSDNINHNWSVMTPEINACDGFVAVIEVRITERPANSAAG
ncbi:hypothetical protein VNI00_011250 [Paramarasmius palmivorus]|uniref:Secreted protein n=1 Tax=Paramarasmius palmivorus TaxID=297713 RepID=A0AAW0CHX8_9AGAR